MKISNYLGLPRPISAFEARYLERMNRVALAFFLAHLPGMMIVAWACDTGPLSALVLTGFVLSGTVAGYLLLDNPRHRSMLFGVTAMLVGGLLVHFGRGPVQIEMHFYFFALLAMLCMFANPAVNLTAAVTVALHHTLGWWLIPESVFNYDAAWWVVAVHAGFVVMETVACCYIAREFFDNVMGLEKKVEARTLELREKQRDMQTVLDNVEQGLVVIDTAGHMRGEPSQALTASFSKPAEGESFIDWLRHRSEKFADMTALGLEMLSEGFMPIDVALKQMPSRLTVEGRTYEFRYQPVVDDDGEVGSSDDVPEQLLVVATDITRQLEAEAEEQRHADMLATFRHIMHDKVGFLEFLGEAESIMAVLITGNYGDLEHFKRLVHTVKGNAAIFGMKRVAHAANELESAIIDTGEMPSEAAVQQLVDAWQEIRGDLESLLGQREEDKQIAVDDREYERVLRAMLDDEVDRRLVATMVQSWRLEPAQERLTRIGEQIKRIAARLRKSGVEVAVDGGDIRLDREHFAPFWAGIVHVLRNAVDHGIESAEEREAVGKPAGGRIALSTRVEGGEFVFSVSDDGRGIDYDRLRTRAIERGIEDAASMAPEDLLFLDGLSSRSEATDVSGRGVGMAAVKESCEALGGRIMVESARGEGTTMSFHYPLNEAVYPGHHLTLGQAAA